MIDCIVRKLLRSPFKHNLLWKEALAHHADVLCVQETHFSKLKPPTCTHKHYPHCFFANAPRKQRGVTIAISTAVNFVLHHRETDEEGRYIILSTTIDNRPPTDPHP